MPATPTDPPLRTPRTPFRAVLLVLVVTLVAGALLGLAGVPSAALFGALVGGTAHALTSSTPLAVPSAAAQVGQGLIGVTIGVTLSLSTLAGMGTDLGPIVAVTVATIAVSLAAGRVLALRRDVSPVTGAFAMVAGGAAGVVSVAHELGADDRVVTVVQYLRVLIVLVSLPIVTAVVFDPGRGAARLTQASAPLVADLLYVALALALGLLLARVAPVPTGSLLGPMAVAAALVSTGWLGAVSVPTGLQWLAFALIGVQVGLRFTRASLVCITRMLPLVLALIVAVIASTALMAVALVWLTPLDGLTAYLATTPGGLFAVLALAADSGADVTYVTGVQILRLVVILLLTPLLARWLRPAGPPGR